MKQVKKKVAKKTPLPILYASRPAAGFPAPGDDLVEQTLDLNQLLIKQPASTFFVRIEGDSMEGAGLSTGDILVVDRSKEPKHGSIVVAAVFGELVVKRFSKKGKVVQLISENPRYEPIVITSDEECFVWGVVIGMARTYFH